MTNNWIQISRGRKYCMRNVYDIKNQEKLNIVLMKNNIIGKSRLKDDWSVGVFIHLYYTDALDYYAEYINGIPQCIDIYLSYSDNIIKDKISGMLNGDNQVCFIKKENRGRDISAFLIAFRKYMLNYQYVCFLHDKKEKIKERKQTIEEWVYSLWENMLASAEYIHNIIWKLETNDTLGLLVPPSIIAEHSNTAIENIWYGDYENTRKLAERLDLNCDMDVNKTPITQGTCFWAKTDAIKKLIEYEWKYEDFPAEPLPGDGTISHAVERILAYVAQDAGFATGWVMTDEYANDYIVKLLKAYACSFPILKNELGIRDLYDIKCRKAVLEKIKKFISESDRIYIYGAGKRAKFIFKMFVEVGDVLEAFVVSNRTEEQEFFLGIRIVQFDELDITDNMGFIVGVGAKLKDEIVENLHKHNIEDNKILVLE